MKAACSLIMAGMIFAAHAAVAKPGNIYKAVTVMRSIKPLTAPAARKNGSSINGTGIHMRGSCINGTEIHPKVFMRR
jgi:hypothetical protein